MLRNINRIRLLRGQHLPEQIHLFPPAGLIRQKKNRQEHQAVTSPIHMLKNPGKRTPGEIKVALHRPVVLPRNVQGIVRRLVSRNHPALQTVVIIRPIHLLKGIMNRPMTGQATRLRPAMTIQEVMTGRVILLQRIPLPAQETPAAVTDHPVGVVRAVVILVEAVLEEDVPVAHLLPGAKANQTFNSSIESYTLRDMHTCPAAS